MERQGIHDPGLDKNPPGVEPQCSTRRVDFHLKGRHSMACCKPAEHGTRTPGIRPGIFPWLRHSRSRQWKESVGFCPSSAWKHKVHTQEWCLIERLIYSYCEHDYTHHITPTYFPTPKEKEKTPLNPPETPTFRVCPAPMPHASWDLLSWLLGLWSETSCITEAGIEEGSLSTWSGVVKTLVTEIADVTKVIFQVAMAN
jgi:hypothetical protein